MLTKEEYIGLINQAVTQPAEAWKNDPFELLLKQFPKEMIDKFADSQPEDLIPSTSDDVRTVNSDARIQYSQTLGGIYLEFAEQLKSERKPDSDELMLLSLQDMLVVKKSFEFFLLTGILPFLEPGIGLGAASRSTFIKSWKLYDGNKETCTEKLDFAARVIIALLDSNEALSAQFLPKFIDDVLSVRFQLLELGVDKYESQFEKMLSKCQTDILFGALMFLTQDKKTAKTPKWLKVACGRQMTKILVGKDGLSHLLQYYRERAGDTWTDNLPLTKQVAWHLATVPRLFKHPLRYHEIISQQFFETFWSQPTPDKNTLAVFVCYVEELRVRFSLNADLTVFDKILRFWEILNKKINEKATAHSEQIVEFSARHVTNLQLLSQIQASADQKRLRALLTCLFACAEHVPHVKGILKAALDGTTNLGYNLYHFVMSPTNWVMVEKRQSGKVQEMDGNGMDATPFTDEMWLHGSSNQDEEIARRLDTAFFIVDNVLTQTQTRTVLEMMGYALEDFLKASEKERDDDEARFLSLDGVKSFSSLHAHLLVGCCFERLATAAEDAAFSTEECDQVLRLAYSILNNATVKFLRLAARRQAVDVFQMTADEKKEFEATRDTAKLCLPIVSTVFLLTQGMPRMHDMQIKSMEAMANFAKAADKFPTDDGSFNAALDETKRLLRELNIDMNQVPHPTVPQRADRRRHSHTDYCNDLLEELNDDEPAMKGGALMQIAKAFRNNSHVCRRLLEYGAFDMAKELVQDDDSYVYLAAINCLCEMAVGDRRLFEALIVYYEELSSFDDKPEQIVIRLGRIAEAVGKLFRARGDFSVTYMDRMARVFFRGMREKSDILRASSCGAFGNLLLASRGRGVEKVAVELFHEVHGVIKADQSPLVRRAATDLVRQCLRACGQDVFVMLRESLLDIHREVRRLWKTDRDETVRLHAQLCCEELETALRQTQEDMHRGYSRQIQF